MAGEIATVPGTSQTYTIGGSPGSSSMPMNNTMYQWTAPSNPQTSPASYGQNQSTPAASFTGIVQAAVAPAKSSAAAADTSWSESYLNSVVAPAVAQSQHAAQVAEDQRRTAVANMLMNNPDISAEDYDKANQYAATGTYVRPPVAYGAVTDAAANARATLAAEDRLNQPMKVSVAALPAWENGYLKYVPAHYVSQTIIQNGQAVVVKKLVPASAVVAPGASVVKKPTTAKPAAGVYGKIIGAVNGKPADTSIFPVSKGDAPLQIVRATNGYNYATMPDGTYKNVGLADPSQTPAQTYANISAAAASQAANPVAANAAVSGNGGNQGAALTTHGGYVPGALPVYSGSQTFGPGAIG